MKVEYVGNFTEAMKSYTEGKLSKFISKKIISENENDTVRVKLKIFSNEKCLEISVNNGVRAVCKGDDFYEMVLDCIDKILVQYRRFKNYRHEKPASEIGDMYDNLPQLFSKEKIFFIKEQTDEEAIEEMEFLGHQWFVFKAIDRGNNVCVVYKRLDGSYGIIECR